MAVPNWSPVLPGDRPDHAEAPARHLDRENAALRELVTVYRYLSGLALQAADLAERLLLGRGRENADAGRWAAHLGYDPARDHNGLAIAFELPVHNGAAGPGDIAAQRQRIWESIEHCVATRAPEAIVSARESEVVVVTTTPDAPTGPAMDARQLAVACLARLAELFPAAKVVIGIGGTLRGSG